MRVKFTATLLGGFLLLAFPACSGFQSSNSESSPLQSEQSGSDCGVDQIEMERLMGLSYREFDQDFSGGWRAVDAKDGCSPVAAKLIVRYLEQPSAETLTAEQIRLLNWHAGQVTAYTEPAEALPFFYKAYEDAASEILSDWDLYVAGTIAFLEGNETALQEAYAALSAREVSLEEQQARQAFLDDNPRILMPDGYVTEPNNLPALRGLKRCFGEPYRIAYSECAHRGD